MRIDQDEAKRIAFIDELSYVRKISPYERESLENASQKSGAELMKVLYRVFGQEQESLIAETARWCCEHAELIQKIMLLEGVIHSEDEWAFNREGIECCLLACEYAMELSRQYEPQVSLEIAICLDRCRNVDRKSRLRILV